MIVGGVSIILILGVFNLLLLIFQLCTGMRWVKVSFKMHRRTGVTLFVSAVIHAGLAYVTHTHS
jgi:hypothetical protein